ncbi:unnamed protein product [Polarella glacialis]|uniref:AB hydrolase-1 domain-containing protein n=1 Tax=Polarella glacialis TaxID=89957 RepID=A0A813HNL5_POLGL|nr:unnamed protein product [Polarella glacialis]CAE8640233.1 unnamed protein product [Polarella glacialis]
MVLRAVRAAEGLTEQRQWLSRLLQAQPLASRASRATSRATSCLRPTRSLIAVVLSLLAVSRGDFLCFVQGAQRQVWPWQSPGTWHKQNRLPDNLRGSGASRRTVRAWSGGDQERLQVRMPDALIEIQEALAQEAAARYQRLELQLPEVFSDRPVGATFLGPSPALATAAAAKEQPPILLLHGFDSSALEFRRLLPELEDRGVAVHFLDLLGWGFGDTEGVLDFSPAAKRAHLYAFWQQHLGSRPMVLGGASLGGGIAIDFAAAHPEAVERLVLIDAQGFIDGAPSLGPLGGLGIKLLGSWPLRSIANQMAYYDKALATDDAIRIGRLHVETEGWEAASLNYLNSGGYTLSPLVSRVRVPTLLLWGEKDEILDGTEVVPRFLEELQGPVRLEWIPESGHVPHLEQPQRTAELIKDFLQSSS